MNYILILIFSLIFSSAHASATYQTSAEFLDEVFSSDVPQPQVLWLTKKFKPLVKEILGHDYATMRVRYWGRNHRTVWILEEIGKEKPITTGIVIDNGKIEQVKVLVFRESRGNEVQYPFFTDQFKGRFLNADKVLDRYIDGISGATLSVRALKKLARLALFLHQQSKYANGPS